MLIIIVYLGKRMLESIFICMQHRLKLLYIGILLIFVLQIRLERLSINRMLCSGVNMLFMHLIYIYFLNFGFHF